MWDKLMSGRFLLTISCAVVFVWATMNKFLEAQAVAAILASVFASYFAQGQSNDNKTKTTTTLSGTTTMLTLLLCVLCVPAFADVSDTLKAIAPNTTPSIFYSVKQHSGIDYTTQYALISKDTSVGTFEANVAYGESDTGLGVLAYKTDTLSKLGINVMVLKDIFANVGCGIGYDHISKSDRTFDYGLIAGLGANIKF